MKNIEFTEDFKNAFNLMEHGSRSLFIGGKAGTGKSTLLQYFQENTGKNIAVLAPTGIAAINVGGQTVHSFFGFKPGITLDKVKAKPKADTQLYRNLHTIVIDEVSMLRADLLDCLEKFLRLNGPQPKQSFGGVQMIFIGDLMQLPPVVSREERDIFNHHYPSPYFFSAFCLSNFPLQHLELSKIFRQKDLDFLEVLNAVRYNLASSDAIAFLNQRFLPNYFPAANEMFVSLTTTNAKADLLNREALDKISSPLFMYP